MAHAQSTRKFLVQALKGFVPARLRPHGPEWERREVGALLSRWRDQRVEAGLLNTKGRYTNTLIVPPDASTLIGSRGDEAMIAVVAERSRMLRPAGVVKIVANGTEASKSALQMGLEPVADWPSIDILQNTMRALTEHEISNVYVIGADVMDGYYSPRGAAKMLITADLAARLGISATVLGFSFSEDPDSSLQPVYNEIVSQVRLCVRDEVSLARLRKFTEASAELVADSAFLLKPTEAPSEISRWVETRRRDGRTVIGFNIHPMLFKQQGQEDIAQIVSHAATAIRRVSAERMVSWILVPHDVRSDGGDHICLNPLAEKLKEFADVDFTVVSGRLSANALKATAAILDGVVSGRMHLAIGALGSGVPVLAITYAGKFQGLYAHFQLPDWLMMTPTKNDEDFVGRLTRFVGDLLNLKLAVRQVLPQVLDRSQRNFDV